MPHSQKPLPFHSFCYNISKKKMLKQIFASEKAEIFDENLAFLGKGYKFSDFFPLLFRGLSDNERDNLFSFLWAICNLETPNLTCSPEDAKAATKILGKLGIPENHNVHELLSYLILVYRTTEISGEVCKNIFKFMTHFPINETKVVFMFRQPSGLFQTCGYALHGAIAETSKVVLSLLNEELEFVTNFLNNRRQLKFSSEELEEYKNSCKFDGWLRQGILLVNAYLTYDGAIWDEFTNKLVKAVSEVQKNKENVVYLMAGRPAGNKGKSNLIDKEKHTILQLYHPTHGNPTMTDLKWKNVLPFINTNFLKYQASNQQVGTIIDWGCISNDDTVSTSRMEILAEFFEEVLRQERASISNNGIPLFDIVDRTGSLVMRAEILNNGFYKLVNATN